MVVLEPVRLIYCIEGNNWQIEKPAIARVAIPLSNGTGWCSCSLINNTNQDFKPYVLTANHCLDEQYVAIANNDASQWVFYWNYEYATCANSGTPVLQTTTGATIKANNSVSDFALLELTQDPRNVSGFVPFYMGWDRSGNTGTGGIGIHHPMGDAKKIATYSATPTTSTCMGTLNSNFWMISFIQTTNGYSVMEPGSSGSSLINNQHKIIGQLYGPGYCADIRCENPSSQVVSYGKFNVSWTGNSSANIYRRLDYWLNPNNMSAQTSLDGIMYIPIIGPSTLCVGTSYTFSESNAPAGFTWDKSSNLTITGSGSSVTVTANSSGSGWISIKLGSVELVRKIVEISSSYPAFDYIDGPEEVTPGSSTYTYSAYFEGGNLSSYTWQVYGAPSSWHSITTGGNNAYITFFGEATYQIYVTGENGCGYDSGYMFVSAYNYDEANSYAAYPNPASDLINVEIAAETVAKVKSLLKSATADPVFNIKLLDGQGAVQRCAVSNGKSVQFNVSGLPNGIYYLEINNGVSKKPKSIKVIVKH